MSILGFFKETEWNLLCFPTSSSSVLRAVGVRWKGDPGHKCTFVDDRFLDDYKGHIASYREDASYK